MNDTLRNDNGIIIVTSVDTFRNTKTRNIVNGTFVVIKKEDLLLTTDGGKSFLNGVSQGKEI